MKVCDSYKVDDAASEHPFGHSDTDQHPPCCQGFKAHISCRYVAAVYGSLLGLVINAHRINIGVAILKMVNSTSELPENLTGTCPQNNLEYRMDVDEHTGDFNWSPEIQGYVLSAGHIGFLIPQIFAGRIAEKFGSKLIMMCGLLCTSVTNVISPWAARVDFLCLIGVQVLKGIGLGSMYPALSCFMACWFPEQESRFLSSIVLSGFSVGAFLGAFASGLLCDLSFIGGWPLAFYVFGALGCVLCIYLQLFMYETPESHPSICEWELNYIAGKIKMTSNSTSELKVPWRNILFSVPSLALFYAYFGQVWSLFYFLSVHNLYLGNVLHFPIAKTGVLSSLPFLIQVVVACIASYVADALRRWKGLSVNVIRKGNNAISCIGMTVFMAGIYFAGCDKVLNVSCSMIVLVMGAFSVPGCVTAPIDMSPKFAGTLTAVASTISNASGFIVPIAVGYFIKEEPSLRQWKKVFLTNIIVVASSGIVFQLFGSAEVQPWNDVNDHLETPTRKTKETEQKDAISDLDQLPITIHL